MLVAEKLCAAGYRRIGLAMSREHDDRVRHHWRAGFLTAQSLHALAMDRELMFLSQDWSREAFVG